MRKLLITGGAGFTSSNFVYYLREYYPKDALIILDKLNYAGNLANLADPLHSLSQHNSLSSRFAFIKRKHQQYSPIK